MRNMSVCFLAASERERETQRQKQSAGKTRNLIHPFWLRRVWKKPQIEFYGALSPSSPFPHSHLLVTNHGLGNMRNANREISGGTASHNSTPSDYTPIARYPAFIKMLNLEFFEWKSTVSSFSWKKKHFHQNHKSQWKSNVLNDKGKWFSIAHPTTHQLFYFSPFFRDLEQEEEEDSDNLDKFRNTQSSPQNDIKPYLETDSEDPLFSPSPSSSNSASGSDTEILKAFSRAESLSTRSRSQSASVGPPTFEGADEVQTASKDEELADHRAIIAAIANEAYEDTVRIVLGRELLHSEVPRERLDLTLWFGFLETGFGCGLVASWLACGIPGIWQYF